MRDGDHPCRNWKRAFYQTLLLEDRHILSSARRGEKTIASRHEVVLEEEYLSLMQSAFKYFSSPDRRSQIEQPTSAEKLRTIREEYQYWLEENVSVQVQDLHGGDELRPSFAPIRTEVDELLNTITRNNFVSNLDRMTKDRSSMMTDNGYMGLAPVGTEAGDEVVLLFGCPYRLCFEDKQTISKSLVAHTYVG
jgi:hypothetical protein